MNPSTSVVVELCGPSTGGIRRHVAALCDGLGAHAPTDPAANWIAVPAGPAGVFDGLWGPHGRPEGAPAIRTVPVPGRPDPLAVRRARKVLASVVDETGARLVHAHGLKAALVALGVGVPVVLTLHNTTSDGARRGGPLLRLEQFLESRLIARAQAVICVNAAMAQGAVAAGADPLVVPAVFPRPAPSRSTAEVRAGLGLAPDEPLLVTVARLHRQKGLDLWIDAFPGVLDRHPRAVAVIAGDGPERGALEEQRRLAGPAATSIRLLGARSDAADLLAAADVVVMPSRWEGSPLVAGEALLLERPLVATSVGNLAELVGADEGGRLVPPGDPTALARAVADALSDPIDAARRARIGRQRAERLLDPRPLIEAVRRVYDVVGGE